MIRPPYGKKERQANFHRQKENGSTVAAMLPVVVLPNTAIAEPLSGRVTPAEPRRAVAPEE